MSAALIIYGQPRPLPLPHGVKSTGHGDGLARSRAWLNTHNGMGERVAPEGHDPRTPHPDAVGATSVPGQLWERIAEGRAINYEVYPWHCLNAVEGGPRMPHMRGPRVCVAPRFAIGRHICPVPHSHGILRPDVTR